MREKKTTNKREKKLTLAEIIEKKLSTAPGITLRQAKDLSQGLAMTARNALKKELAEKAKKMSEAPEKEAPLDTPTSRTKTRPGGYVIPASGKADTEITPLMKMNGATSLETYRVAAVKANGLIAVRKLSSSTLNVKFYPNKESWGIKETPEGFSYNVERGYYSRYRADMHDLYQFLKTLPKASRKSSPAYVSVAPPEALEASFNA